MVVIAKRPLLVASVSDQSTDHCAFAVTFVLLLPSKGYSIRPIRFDTKLPAAIRCPTFFENFRIPLYRATFIISCFLPEVYVEANQMSKDLLCLNASLRRIRDETQKALISISTCTRHQ